MAAGQWSVIFPVSESDGTWVTLSAAGRDGKLDLHVGDWAKSSGLRVRLIQQLGDEFRREAVRLVQVPQVRLGQWPARAELGQYPAAAGKQAGEPAFLAAEYLTDLAALLVLTELPQGLLDQRRWEVIQRPAAVGTP
jgi:hypothetical protein